MKKNITILFFCFVAIASAQTLSPYITTVFDYSPAPGQFINVLPKYEQGDTQQQMNQKAQEAIANNKRYLVCLGGWGGSITFGFDHMITNQPGAYDLQILGNTHDGGAEPGIVYVSFDENDNGLPDDTWYEIAGSEYNQPTTKHNYTLTYYRTPADHQPVPNGSIVDAQYIKYADTEGNIGYIEKNSYHTQDYYPQWIEADSLVFVGTLLAKNATFNRETGIFWLSSYDYGYADNHPNTSDSSKINLEWAVDAEGNPANLQGIHFVRIQTGVSQSCGWIGETSTELMGAIDLHTPTALQVSNEAEDNVEKIYNLQGQQIICPQKGHVYIIKTKNGKTIKQLF